MPASKRDVHSFHAADSNICRWAPSWPRNPNCVITTPRIAASTSWNHELPSRMTATQTKANADTMSVIRVQT